MLKLQRTRNGQPWSEDDHRLLKELVSKKASNAMIAAKLKRSWSAVQDRMYVLGLAKGTARGRPARKK